MNSILLQFTKAIFHFGWAFSINKTTIFYHIICKWFVTAAKRKERKKEGSTSTFSTPSCENYNVVETKKTGEKMIAAQCRNLESIEIRGNCQESKFKASSWSRSVKTSKAQRLQASGVSNVCIQGDWKMAGNLLRGVPSSTTWSRALRMAKLRVMSCS